MVNYQTSALPYVSLGSDLTGSHTSYFLTKSQLDPVGDLGVFGRSSVLMGHTRGWIEGPSQLAEVLVVRPSPSW